QGTIAARQDRRPLVRERDMRRADDERPRAVLIRQHDTDTLAADTRRHRLAYRLVPQRTRDVRGHWEVRIPDRLHARGPRPDPILCARRTARECKRRAKGEGPRHPWEAAPPIVLR